LRRRPRLWLDATDAQVREGGRIVSRAVTVAVAVNGEACSATGSGNMPNGKRAVPAGATGPSEAFGRWPSPFRIGFLRSPADRGLRGAKRVIADDHKGLRAAARRVFNATHQRCPGVSRCLVCRTAS
jgi:transposase-like protein